MVKSPNFDFLSEHSEVLVKHAAFAEKYAYSDPLGSLTKLRQFVEAMVKSIFSHIGESEESLRMVEMINFLYSPRRVFNFQVQNIMHTIRKAGNRAIHDSRGSQEDALTNLKLAHRLAIWFHTSFKKERFEQRCFVPPPDPDDMDEEKLQELHALKKKLSEIESIAEEEVSKREEWEERAQEAYKQLGELQESIEASEDELQNFKEQLTKLQEENANKQEDEINTIIHNAYEFSENISLSELETRQIIDQQLRDVGWQVDTQTITYKAGVRPQKGVNIAIAEWPTKDGIADYVLFVGFQPLAIVEAKRKNEDVAGALEQAKRYSKNFVAQDEEILIGEWREFKVPFLFSTNGRPYLRQIIDKSGVWFQDIRLASNTPRALPGWYSPDGLSQLLERDITKSKESLKKESLDYLDLRPYQKDAIRNIEEALTENQQNILVAMATGTGKTRTCIALVYRLIKHKFFHRVLFVVDRSALGEQATNAFQHMPIENQTFTKIYDIKEMADIVPEKDTRLHIATIQGMSKRLFHSENEIAVDQYDCIVIDECHRGYTLDREMSDVEMTFRDQNDYISQYRRVLEYFDAVKIGLTATPALHTVEIFGHPVYTYGYRQAVIDGFLIDHEPPTIITTELAQSGMNWQVGEEIEIYNGTSDTISNQILDDEVNVEIERYNTSVITENFNRTVCETLAKYIDPTLPGKTLVFCANDNHADMVVRLLKEQFAGVDDEAIAKITGKTDRVLEKIRRFKNEVFPSIAVTVDLLTTGIDVPQITNLVFIRRVKSRILYEQMLGRATRLCEDIQKESFRIFDTVDLYTAMSEFTEMRPVARRLSIPLTRLIEELATTQSEDGLREVHNQLVMSLRRRRNRLQQQDVFQSLDMDVDTFINNIQSWGPQQTREWFQKHSEVAAILQRATGSQGQEYIVSHHPDRLLEVTTGYGENTKPQDYIESFKKFIAENINEIPALIIAQQRPRDLTRKQLKELKRILDAQGYSEVKLRTAWNEWSNEEIIASIIGYIRNAALGSPLIAYEQRVEQAMKKILASDSWTDVQKKWLKRIGKQLKKETIVDKQAIDDGRFADHGGFKRLNKIFEGRLEQILQQFHDKLWAEDGDIA